MCNCSGELMHGHRIALFGPFVSGGEDRPDTSRRLYKHVTFWHVLESYRLRRRSQLSDVLKSPLFFVS